MAFVRPTLTELIDRAAADLLVRFPGADTGLRRSVLGVLARVIAGAVHGLYGHLDWVARQILPDTSDEEVLVRQAALYGVEPKGGEVSAGNVSLTGVDGAVVPVGTVLQRADAAEYVTTAEATIAAGVATAAVAAAEPGQTGDASMGVALTFVSPVAGVSASAVVAANGLTGGADAEKVEALRARLLGRIREQPQGGSTKDYERWALEVADVTRVWVKPAWDGLGTVGVTFVCDSRDDPIPVADDLTDVAEHIDPLRPVTAQVIVFAPTPVALDLVIHPTPDTAAVRAAIIASIEDLLLREAEPGGTLKISQIRESVSGAAGETDNIISSPDADVDHGPAEYPVMGDVTWV